MQTWAGISTSDCPISVTTRLCDLFVTLLYGRVTCGVSGPVMVHMQPGIEVLWQGWPWTVPLVRDWLSLFSWAWGHPRWCHLGIWVVAGVL